MSEAHPEANRVMTADSELSSKKAQADKPLNTSGLAKKMSPSMSSHEFSLSARWKLMYRFGAVLEMVLFPSDPHSRRTYFFSFNPNDRISVVKCKASLQ